MAPLERLGADDLRALVGVFGDALRTHRERLNRLNVYPVPDGDTGTNMSLTVDSVLAELDGAGRDMASVCRAIARGSLMGARGNSGVILSQIMRGLTTSFTGSFTTSFTSSFTGKATGTDDDEGDDDEGDKADDEADEAVDGARFARGLAAAADGAYQAVGKPVEGTILTVVREAAEGAQAAIAVSPAAPLCEVLEAALTAAAAALDRTPELLDVLRRAGVVDAGGAGFVLFLHAGLHVVAGRELPEPDALAGPVGVESPEVVAPAGDPGGAPDDVGNLRYEVMYLLEAPDAEMPAFRAAWAAIGGSIVVVGGEGTWNCHIHCDDIGAAIEAGIAAGRPHQIRVTDLAEQVEEERWVREGQPAEGQPAEGQPAEGQPAEGHSVDGHSAEESTTAIVAVANGEGLRRLFRSLGAAGVVAGGQSMNPSTAQLLEAVEATAADQVVILPNNANIVPVAEQVDGLTAKAIQVVPTRGIAEGLVALLAYDPAADVEHNAKAMGAAATDVVAGEVTRAVRSSTSDAGPISEGDWLGIGPKGIEVVGASAFDATVGLLDALVGPEHELAILIEGEQAVEEETNRITAWLSEHRSGLEVEVHHGGQPLYPYLLGIE